MRHPLDTLKDFADRRPGSGPKIQFQHPLPTAERLESRRVPYCEIRYMDIIPNTRPIVGLIIITKYVYGRDEACSRHKATWN